LTSKEELESQVYSIKNEVAVWLKLIQN